MFCQLNLYNSYHPTLVELFTSLFSILGNNLSLGGGKMMLNWIYTAMVALSILSGLHSGQASHLGSALLEGTKNGIQLAIALAGPLLFFSGLGKLMDRAGITAFLSRLLSPFLGKLFPDMKKDPILAGHITANFCANLLGLGNAATPRGIGAAGRLKKSSTATDSLCRLVVLNTASIQLIPTSVAAIRSGLGCKTPFDILPAVWITSLLSAGAGLTAAWIFGKLWKHD